MSRPRWTPTLPPRKAKTRHRYEEGLEHLARAKVDVDYLKSEAVQNSLSAKERPHVTSALSTHHGVVQDSLNIQSSMDRQRHTLRRGYDKNTRDSVEKFNGAAKASKDELLSSSETLKQNRHDAQLRQDERRLAEVIRNQPSSSRTRATDPWNRVLPPPKPQTRVPAPRTPHPPFAASAANLSQQPPQWGPSGVVPHRPVSLRSHRAASVRSESSSARTTSGAGRSQRSSRSEQRHSDSQGSGSGERGGEQDNFPEPGPSDPRRNTFGMPPSKRNTFGPGPYSHEWTD